MAEEAEAIRISLSYSPFHCALCPAASFAGPSAAAPHFAAQHPTLREALLTPCLDLDQEQRVQEELARRAGERESELTAKVVGRRSDEMRRWVFPQASPEVQPGAEALRPTMPSEAATDKHSLSSSATLGSPPKVLVKVEENDAVAEDPRIMYADESESEGSSSSDPESAEPDNSFSSISESLPQADKIDGLSCLLCTVVLKDQKKSSSNRNMRLNHISTAHMKDVLWRCRLCSYTARDYSGASVRAHVKRRHPGAGGDVKVNVRGEAGPRLAEVHQTAFGFPLFGSPTDSRLPRSGRKQRSRAEQADLPNADAETMASSNASASVHSSPPADASLAMPNPKNTSDKPLTSLSAKRCSTDQAKPETYSCSLCSSSFKVQADWKSNKECRLDHVASRHLDAVLWRCLLCDFASPAFSPRNIRVHQRDTHQLRPADYEVYRESLRKNHLEVIEALHVKAFHLPVQPLGLEKGEAADAMSRVAAAPKKAVWIQSAVCALCGFPTSFDAGHRKQRLSAHIRKRHLDVDSVFACDLCPWTSKTLFDCNAKKHIRKIHSVAKEPERFVVSKMDEVKPKIEQKLKDCFPKHFGGKK